MSFWDIFKTRQKRIDEWKKNFRSVRTRCREDFNDNVIVTAKWFVKNWKEQGCEWSDLIDIQIMLIEEQVKKLES